MRCEDCNKKFRRKKLEVYEEDNFIIFHRKDISDMTNGRRVMIDCAWEDTNGSWVEIHADFWNALVKELKNELKK